MPKIIQLSPHIANLIAAGEVVERPASVVKELLENAVDAGASKITIEIRDGGMTFLRVTDNGCGMTPEDARTAFLRHATSKLRSAEDLAAIGTMGFRGEALAAIASVSRIDLMTKTPGAISGVSLHLEAGKILDESEVGCPEGTTIIVRDLFYNTPARMKFMKSDTVEGARVASAVQLQALAHPQVAFQFLRDGKQVLSTPGTGGLQAAVYCVYGRDCARMVPVESRWDSYTLTGFVSRPTDARPSRNLQTFFVNNRPVKSRLLISALEEAYRNQIMVGKFPACVLHLESPAGAVDVNVHPAKTEVKFLSEKAVFDCVHYGVLGALNKQVDRPEFGLPKNRTPLSRLCRPRRLPLPSTKLSPNRTFSEPCPPRIFRPCPRFWTKSPVRNQLPPLLPLQKSGRVRKSAPGDCRNTCFSPGPGGGSAPQRTRASQTVLPHSFTGRPGRTPAPAGKVFAPGRRRTSPASEPEQTALEMPPESPWRMVGELYNSYILVEQGEEAFLIDKHAAHERILFEKLKANQETISSQSLISPISVRLSPAAAGELLANQDMLDSLGFSIEEFGENTLLIRQIPMDLGPEDAASTLESLAADLLNGRRAQADTVRDELLHTVACKAAIKAGWKNDEAELLAVAKAVMSRADLKYCPHGRPICVTLSKKQLEKQFKRT